MLKQKYAVFTMDVEAFTDTECVAKSSEHVDVDLLDGFDEYIRILDKHNIRSTLFTVGTLAPKMTEKLQSCIANGHRVALHNYEHVAPMDQSPDSFRLGVQKAKDHLSKLFGTEIEGFRAPFFSMDNQRLNILKELGFRYDSSRLDFSKARHTVKLNMDSFKQFTKDIFYDGDFFEFGLSKHKIFGMAFPISGGGYVRLNNWPFIKSVIRHYLQQNDFYVFYLHPFELTHQKVPIMKDLKSHDQYYLSHGIKSYGNHIEQLIQMLKSLDYQFITFEELADKLSVTASC